MAKLNLPDIGSLANNASARQAINDNFAALEEAFDNTLSRDGTLPNQMEADIDLNSNDLLNVGEIDASRYLINGVPLSQSVAYSDKRYDYFTGNDAQQEFTLSANPGSLGNLEVSIDGLLQRPGIDFTYEGTTLAFTVAPPTTVENNVMVRYDEAVPTGVTNSTAVEFRQSGLGMVLRNILSKAREIVHADDRGLAGDGVTDDTVAMQNLVDASSGKLLLLGFNKTYKLTSSITIPDDVTMISNGSTFKKTVVSTSYAITVGSRFEADRLVLEVAGGATDAGLKLLGSDINIGFTKVTSLTADTGSGASVHGINVADAATRYNIRLGGVEISDFVGAMFVNNIDGIHIGRVKITNYKTGVYFRDVKNGTFLGSHISGLGGAGVGGPGENGLLMESTVNFGTENLTFINWHIQDSGEHGFRIGGDRVVRNMHFKGCSTLNTGAHPSATGAAAFKVLHGNTNPTFHIGIFVDDFLAEDCSEGAGGLNNFAAFQIGKVVGGQFSNITIRRRNNPNYSCKFAFQIFSSEDIHINNPNAIDVMRHGIQIIEPTVVVPAYPLFCRHVHVNGGNLHVVETANSSAVVRVTCGGSTFNDIKINGTTLRGGGMATLHDAPGAGSYLNCEVIASYLDPGNTGGDPPFRNSNEILLNVRAPFYGTFNPQGLDGSVYQDKTNGVLKYRAAGNWITPT